MAPDKSAGRGHRESHGKVLDDAEAVRGRSRRFSEEHSMRSTTLSMTDSEQQRLHRLAPQRFSTLPGTISAPLAPITQSTVFERKIAPYLL